MFQQEPNLMRCNSLLTGFGKKFPIGHGILLKYPKQDIKNVIVASMNGMKIGLEVESVREIIDVNEKQVIPMPTIMNANQSCFNDVASYDKQLIVMFEVSKLMPQSEQQGIKQLIDDNT